LVRSKRRLLPELTECSSREIVDLKQAGRDVEVEEQELCVTYSGDTGPGVFRLEPRLFTSRVLVLECTFLNPGTRQKGRRFGHIHFEDLVEHADRFQNEALVLCHLSQRHRWSELLDGVRSRLPDLADRIHLVGSDEDRG
jgi:ribonuclease Z